MEKLENVQQTTNSRHENHRQKWSTGM